MARKILKGLGVVVVLVVLALGAAVVYGLTAWDRPVRGPARALTAPTDSATIARGEHLYRDALVCWMCHGGDGELQYPSAPQSGGRLFDLSTTGPGFGRIWAPNLTSDTETGLGAWTDGELVRTLREGVDREGRLLFPIMEAELYNGLSDEDVLALVAYIRTLPPVKKAVPGYEPSPVAKLLMTYVMKPAREVTGPVTAPPKGVTAEYGTYLARHVAPCAGCHTPRSPENGQWDWSRPFAGGIFSIDEPYVSWRGSNLTPHPQRGLGAWSEEDFIRVMRKGRRPDGRVLIASVMPWSSYAHWSDDDLKAVWLYLKSLPPDANEVAPTTLRAAAAGAPGLARGEAIFEAVCLGCHGPRGAGTQYTEVALAKAGTEMDDETLRGTIEEGVETMPGYAKTLDASQLDDLAAYIRTFAPFDAARAAEKDAAAPQDATAAPDHGSP